MTFKVRGIRGAISVEENSKEDIVSSTTSLLKEMIKQNSLVEEEICSIFFSTTKELDQEFPAISARKIGLSTTPLICMTEIPVEGSLPFCVRVLIHYNTDKLQKDMVHVYLRKASALRPDITKS